MMQHEALDRANCVKNVRDILMENNGVAICEGGHNCVATNYINIELQDMGDKTPDVLLNNLRAQNESGVIAHLNINFIYNKFEALKSLVENKVDILVITDTKIDESFPSNQFLIEWFSTPFRADRNCHSGGRVTFVCA